MHLQVQSQHVGRVEEDAGVESRLHDLRHAIHHHGSLEDHRPVVRTRDVLKAFLLVNEALNLLAQRRTPEKSEALKWEKDKKSGGEGGIT